MGVIGREIDPRANIFLLREGDKFEGKGVAAGGDTVGASVVGTINGTVGSASHAIGTECVIPEVTSIAVGEPTDVVSPTPV